MTPYTGKKIVVFTCYPTVEWKTIAPLGVYNLSKKYNANARETIQDLISQLPLTLNKWLVDYELHRDAEMVVYHDPVTFETKIAMTTVLNDIQQTEFYLRWKTYS